MNRALPPDSRAFRLRSWPELPDGLRIAPIYRLLSTMTVKPVSRGWIRQNSPLSERDVDTLLAFLGPLVVESELPVLTQAVAAPAPWRAAALAGVAPVPGYSTATAGAW